MHYDGIYDYGRQLSFEETLLAEVNRLNAENERLKKALRLLRLPLAEAMQSIDQELSQ